MEKKKDGTLRLLRAGIHLHRPVPPDFLLHARPFFARELTGAVATPGIHDPHFMGCMAPRNRLQRGRQMARLVVGRDDDRDHKLDATMAAAPDTAQAPCHSPMWTAARRISFFETAEESRDGVPVRSAGWAKYFTPKDSQLMAKLAVQPKYQ